MHMLEYWEPIKGYETIYSISNMGAVKRDGGKQGTHPGKMLKSRPRGNTPYLFIQLWRCGQWRNVSVHRLVAETYLDPCPPGFIVHHKNGNKLDNRVHNLEWVSRSQNVRRAIAEGLLLVRRGESVHFAKLTKAIAQLIRVAHGSQRQVARRFNISPSTVSRIKAGRIWNEPTHAD